MKKKPVRVSFLEAQLKKKIRTELKLLGYKKGRNGELYVDDLSKDGIRALHAKQRNDKLLESASFLKKSDQLLQYFASGVDINPHKITPRLEMVTSNTWQSDLFRMATLTWSIPVSQGYGRRMRFLVWDEYNDKLIGIIALGDPVFNLKVRDNYIGWNCDERKNKLVNIMDAFILGSLPPYNLLLCGKLVASLVRTQEIRKAFEDKYKNKIGVISKTVKNPQLVIVTTSSALGRSSVYNRLKLDGKQYFKSIGYTQGWGHFHISNELFNELRKYLAIKKHSYAFGHEFGDGPNWRLRTTRAAFKMLGLKDDLLKHGIKREVFLCEIARNARQFLSGEDQNACYDDLLDVKTVSNLAINRWVIPRAEKRPEFARWSRDSILRLLEINTNSDLKGKSLDNRVGT